MRIGAFQVPGGRIQLNLLPRRNGNDPTMENFFLPRPRNDKTSNQNMSVICHLKLFIATKIRTSRNVSIVCDLRLFTANRKTCHKLMKNSCKTPPEGVKVRSCLRAHLAVEVKMGKCF